MSEPLEIRVGMFGAKGAHKTEITYCYVEREMGDIPSIDDSFSKQIVIGSRTINVEVVDTLGQDDFKEMRQRYYASCDCFVLVYNVNDSSSLEMIREIYNDIQQAKLNPIHAIIAGNIIKEKNKDSIPIEEAQKVANELHCQVLEVNPKTGLNVNELFETLIKDVLNLKDDSKDDSKDGEGYCLIL